MSIDTAFGKSTSRSIKSIRRDLGTARHLVSYRNRQRLSVLLLMTSMHNLTQIKIQRKRKSGHQTGGTLQPSPSGRVSRNDKNSQGWKVFLTPLAPKLPYLRAHCGLPVFSSTSSPLAPQHARPSLPICSFLTTSFWPPQTRKHKSKERFWNKILHRKISMLNKRSKLQFSAGKFYLISVLYTIFLLCLFTHGDNASLSLRPSFRIQYKSYLLLVSLKLELKQWSGC